MIKRINVKTRSLHKDRAFFGKKIFRQRNKIRVKTRQIEEIKKEGISVVEYSLDKNDLNRLNKEINNIKLMLIDLEILNGYYELWRLNKK